MVVCNSMTCYEDIIILNKIRHLFRPTFGLVSKSHLYPRTKRAS